MTEDQIAADLASKLPEEGKITTEYPDPPTDDPQSNNNFVDKLLPEELLTQSQLLDYFGVPINERHTPQVDQYINEVYAWARENAQSGDFLQLLRVINEQELHMGSKQRPGRLSRLYQYIKIAKIRKDLAEKERLLYG